MQPYSLMDSSLATSPIPLVFRSIFFVDGGSHLVATQSLWLPIWLGWMGTLMLFTLLSALQGADGLWYLLGGLGIGGISMYAWLTGYVHRNPAELVIEGDIAHVRTIWQVCNKLDGIPLLVTGFSIKNDHQFHVNLGQEVYEINQKQWPDYTHLVHALRRASTLGSEPLRV